MLLAEPDWARWRANWRASLPQIAGDAEHQMDVLRHFQHAQRFRLLAQDLAGQLTVERLADHLSALADMVLEATLAACWAHLAGAGAPAPRFAIIGYGKLGGKELGYASDLDIVFLFDVDENDAEPDARWSVTRASRKRLNTWLSSNDRGRPALRNRPAPAPRRGHRPAGVEPAFVSQIPAREGLDLGAPGADPRPVRRRRRRHRRRLRGRTRGDPARVARPGRTSRRTSCPCASGCTPATPTRRRCSTSSTIRAAWSTSSSPCSSWCSPTRTGIRSSRATPATSRCSASPANSVSIPAALAGAVADAYRDYRRAQHQLRLTGARHARVDPAAHGRPTRSRQRAVGNGVRRSVA